MPLFFQIVLEVFILIFEVLGLAQLLRNLFFPHLDLFLRLSAFAIHFHLAVFIRPHLDPQTALLASPPSCLSFSIFFTQLTQLRFFRIRNGEELPDDVSHPLSLEGFEERQVLSLAEEPETGRMKARSDPPNWHPLRLQAHRYHEAAPCELLAVETEEFRCKYAALSYLWLFAHKRQPGHSMYADLDETTFSKFLDKLLDKKNFKMSNEVNARSATVGTLPQPRARVPYKLTRTKGLGINAALWTAIQDNEYRTESCVQLVATANCPATMRSRHCEYEVKALRSIVDRSRTPRPVARGCGKGTPSTALGPRWLRLSLFIRRAMEMRQRRRVDVEKANLKRSSNDRIRLDAISNGKLTFDAILQTNPVTTGMYSTRKPTKANVCNAFQSNARVDPSCAREHCCIGKRHFGQDVCLPSTIWSQCELSVSRSFCNKISTCCACDQV